MIDKNLSLNYHGVLEEKQVLNQRQNMKNCCNNGRLESKKRVF